jgi:hypothetical protein
MRIVQLQKGSKRAMALVAEPHLRVLEKFDSTYALAQAAILQGTKLSSLIEQHAKGEILDYNDIYEGKSEWKLLSPIDHPEEPGRCLVSGTGLTHLGSAKDRQAMHEMKESELTDSMKIFRWGVENGRPAAGKFGIAPEWFYKGCGTVLRAHGEPLLVPAYAEDGGEEGEIAGVYMIDRDGQPCRIGMTNGNEFADHIFEKKNYLNLAGSKMRTCSLGPELVIDAAFDSVVGKVTIKRDGKEFWSKEIRSGEAEMCHSRQNIEHHHFKFEPHRRPGDVHVHYFGAHSLSFGAGVRLQNGDVMEITWQGYGRPLQNPLSAAKGPAELVTVKAL